MSVLKETDGLIESGRILFGIFDKQQGGHNYQIKVKFNVKFGKPGKEESRNGATCWMLQATHLPSTN